MVEGGPSGDDISVVRELVSALEDSETGDAVLDLRLSQYLADRAPVHVGTADAALTAELAPETVEAILGEVCAPYTRSIDAALPGENIVLSMFSGRKRRWVSVHRETGGREHVGWAATEPLARRAAALRGFALADIAGGTETAARRPLGLAEALGEDGAAGASLSAEEAGTEDDRAAWKVNF